MECIDVPSMDTNTSMKKLLFLVNVDWFFISHRLPIAITALKHGYEVHIATSITNKQAELESYGLVVHPLSISRGKTSISNEISTLWKIIQTIKQIKPDLLHLVTIKPVLYGGLAARFCQTKGIVAAISGLGYVFTTTGKTSTIRRWLISFIYRLALKHSRLKVIFQNHDDQKILSKAAKLAHTQSVIIPGSGVDLSIFAVHPEPLDPLVVVMAARLLSDKGVREFVEAATQIHELHPNIIFQLVGAIDLDNPASITQQQIEDWQKNTPIQLLGQRSDIPELFSKAHIVVLPSYREGFPKVLIEAAACGRAVITTDVPGCRDAIISGQTGLLVPVRNTKALAEAIKRLIENKTLRQQMGKAGRKLAEERYTIEQVVARHLAIYQELLDAK